MQETVTGTRFVTMNQHSLYMGDARWLNTNTIMAAQDASSHDWLEQYLAALPDGPPALQRVDSPMNAQTVNDNMMVTHASQIMQNNGNQIMTHAAQLREIAAAQFNPINPTHVQTQKTQDVTEEDLKIQVEKLTAIGRKFEDLLGADTQDAPPKKRPRAEKKACDQVTALNTRLTALEVIHREELTRMESQLQEANKNIEMLNQLVKRLITGTSK